MGEKKRGSDQISHLPLPILHNILSFLPATDLNKTCVLSKKFLSAAHSFQEINLDCRQFTSAFVGYVSYKIQCLELHNVCLQKFRLRAQITDCEEADAIKKVISRVIRARVRELDINLLHPWYYLPRTIKPESCSIVTLKLAGLRLLKSNGLDMISGWPLLQYLRVSNCTGLKNFKFSSAKIISIHLECCEGLGTVKIQSPSLQNFKFVGQQLHNKVLVLCDIDLSGCLCLKSLSLDGVCLVDNWLEGNIPNLFKLEHLELRNLKYGAGRLVSSESLKKLAWLGIAGESEIRATNLKSCRVALSTADTVKIQTSTQLKHISCKMPYIITKDFLKEQVSNMVGFGSLVLEFSPYGSLIKFDINRHKDSPLLSAVDKVIKVKIICPILVSSTMDHSPLKDIMNSETPLDVTLSIDSRCPLDNHNLITFWNWIASFGHVKALKLVFISVQEVGYPEKRKVYMLAPIYDLKYLTIKLLIWRTISPELVDSFLWQSPKMETLHFVSAGPDTRSIEFQYGSRTCTEADLICCKRLSMKCWRHSLRRVVLKNFDGVERDNLVRFFSENAVLI